MEMVNIPGSPGESGVVQRPTDGLSAADDASSLKLTRRFLFALPVSRAGDFSARLPSAWVPQYA